MKSKYYIKTICPRCGHSVQGNWFDPCPYCRNDFAVNYETVFDVSGGRLPEAGLRDGIYRFSDFFAFEEGSPDITLGEGNTPLRKLERLGKYLGLSELYMKDEAKNPTYSHKDRLASLLVSRAAYENAEGIALASTGNQGIAVAAYANAANIPCVVFTTPNASPTMSIAMRALGAQVFITPTMDDRLFMLRKLVCEQGYFPASGICTPPIGSCCYAVDAYKTIAFEVYEQMGEKLPDWFIVPSSYGDTLYGIHKGMKDLVAMGYVGKTSRMAGAEVFGATRKSLESGGEKPLPAETFPSLQTSIAVGYTTFLTMRAIRESNGIAEKSDDINAIRFQKILAETEGIIAELSSTASLVILEKMISEGKIKSEDSIVILMTSTGFKETQIIDKWIPDIPVIQPTMESFLAARKTYQRRI